MTNPKSDMVHAGLNQRNSRQKNGHMSFNQHPKIYSSWNYSLSMHLEGVRAGLQDWVHFKLGFNKSFGSVVPECTRQRRHEGVSN